MKSTRYVVTWTTTDHTGSKAKAFEHFDDSVAFAHTVAVDAALGHASIGRQLWRILARKWVFDGWFWGVDRDYEFTKPLNERQPLISDDPRKWHEAFTFEPGEPGQPWVMKHLDD